MPEKRVCFAGNILPPHKYQLAAPLVSALYSYLIVSLVVCGAAETQQFPLLFYKDIFILIPRWEYNVILTEYIYDNLWHCDRMHVCE